MDNKFHVVLDHIRFQTKETDDVTRAIEDHTHELLSAVLSAPLDCGLKRFKSFSLGFDTTSKKTTDEGPNGYLLVVRGVLEDGQDVVAFVSGETWIAPFIEFAYSVEGGLLKWKPDTPRGHRGSKRTFLDSLIDGPAGNGAVDPKGSDGPRRKSAKG